MEIKPKMLYSIILIIPFILFDGTNTFAQNSEERTNLFKMDEDAICDEALCNYKGVCIGSKYTNFCICKVGYTGLHCEFAPCDSERDCNGKGLCIGTEMSYTCVCQLGFTGEKCQISISK